MAPVRPIADQRGFTLIELLVCIMILGVLAAIALPAFLNQRAKGEDTEAKSTLRTAATALVTYEMGTGTFDATVAELVDIEPALSEARDLQVTGTVDTFVIQEESADLTLFSMSRDATGRMTRDCSVPDFGLCRSALDADGNRW